MAPLNTSRSDAPPPHPPCHLPAQPADPSPIEQDDVSRETVDILVTGAGVRPRCTPRNNQLLTPFQPFPAGSTAPNPSWECVRRMDPFLPATSSTPAARLCIPPAALRVTYSAVDALYRDIEQQAARYAVVLHVGLAASYPTFTLETRAHKHGYVQAGVDGQTPDAATQSRRFAAAPEVLESRLRLAEVRERWDGPAVELRESANAGRYLCEYMLFNALASFGEDEVMVVKGKTRRSVVGFVHVPLLEVEAKWAWGAEVIAGFVRAMLRVWSEQADETVMV